MIKLWPNYVDESHHRDFDTYSSKYVDPDR